MSDYTHHSLDKLSSLSNLDFDFDDSKRKIIRNGNNFTVQTILGIHEIDLFSSIIVKDFIE